MTLPQPPELGWYPEDAQWCEERGIDMPGVNMTGAQELDDSTMLRESARESEDWDSTLLSSRAQPAPIHPVYVLRNTSNGQEARIEQNAILGRKPTSNGDAVITLVDSTRTVSRNHARIEFKEDGTAWISDLDSLNGTFVIEGETETAVEGGNAAQIADGMTLRIGDEFYEVSEEPTVA